MVLDKLLVRGVRRAGPAQVKHVALEPAAPGELVRRVYAQVERDFGMLAPPVRLHAAAPRALAASWMMLRESLVATGRVERRVKETVAAAVSLANSCPYCVDVHGAALYGLTASRDAAAVASGRLGDVADRGLRDVALWGRDLPAHGDHRPADEDLPELVGVAVTFHYLNRMVNVFLRDPVFPPAAPAGVRRGLQRMVGRMIRPIVAREHVPGAALALLPGAPVSAGLEWAACDPVIEDAFARAAAAFEAEGRDHVPAAVRELVLARLEGWAGEPPGLSRGWVEDEVRPLPAGQRPAARLALLTAFASYQVDALVVEEARTVLAPDTRGDEELIALTAWSSFSAALAQGARLAARGTGPRSDAREPFPKRGL